MSDSDMTDLPERELRGLVAQRQRSPRWLLRAKEAIDGMRGAVWQLELARRAHRPRGT